MLLLFLLILLPPPVFSQFEEEFEEEIFPVGEWVMTAGKRVNEVMKVKPPKEIEPLYPEGDIAMNLATANTLGIPVPPEVKQKIKHIH